MMSNECVDAHFVSTRPAEARAWDGASGRTLIGRGSPSRHELLPRAVGTLVPRALRLSEVSLKHAPRDPSFKVAGRLFLSMTTSTVSVSSISCCFSQTLLFSSVILATSSPRILRHLYIRLFQLITPVSAGMDLERVLPRRWSDSLSAKRTR